MSVDDIEYFARVKPRNKWDYQLAHNAELLSSKNPEDAAEFARRVAMLASHKTPEEKTKQVISFISEVEVFNMLHDAGKEPHWVPESGKRKTKSPDICYKQDGVEVPVEVKTLHIEAREFSTWANPGTFIESSPDWDYFDGCANKLESFFKDTVEKFQQFSGDSFKGELYLIFLPASQVRLRDGEDGKPLMQERIRQYARDNLDKRIKFTSINSLDKW